MPAFYIRRITRHAILHFMKSALYVGILSDVLNNICNFEIERILPNNVTIFGRSYW